MATSKEIIKRAQEAAGEYATGYKGDISLDSLEHICEMIWIRAANLSYSFDEWFREMHNVIGKKAFEFWFTNLCEFEQKKMEAYKYCVFHGIRYCEK